MELCGNLYTVSIIISNKEFLKDPEGETVLNDLILKKNYSDFISVRSARSFTILVKAKSENDAIEKVNRMCNELRLYNPVVSQCEVSLKTR